MAPQSSDGITCRQVLDLLDPYVDGELDETVVTGITAHTDHCKNCAAELDLASEIRREFDRLPQFDTPIDLIVRAGEARPEVHLGSATVPIGWRIHRRLVAALTAAAVIAVAASVVLLRPEAPPEQPAVDSASADRTQTEAKLAFALIANATRRAENELMDGVLKERVLGRAVRGISRSFEFAIGSAQQPLASPIPDPTPKQGGMI